MRPLAPVARRGDDRVRQAVVVRGLVQGVGFRPFACNLARALGLTGSVRNRGTSVELEVEGNATAVGEFVHRLRADAPPLAEVASVSTSDLPVIGQSGFLIIASEHGGGGALVAPDVATCEACLRELADPTNRRYRHPFISCTDCGPRYTVVSSLPYDRERTTMAGLPLCGACAGEYADPADRRFHAQTIACNDCGPTLALHVPGAVDLAGDPAMVEARRLLSAGAVVAVKGIGGYHLACDAGDEGAVAVLRKRKDRGDKPFAVMVADVADAEEIAEVSRDERTLLAGPRRPVLLLTRRRASAIPLAESVAPGAAHVGVLLAYTPVHRLLFGLPGDQPGPRVLVMTSGNLSGEPLAVDDADARGRLAGLADAWLSHDRPIQVPCDDSVVRVVAGEPLPVRRSRGYAPLPLPLPLDVVPALAVGGDLKTTFGLAAGRQAWLSAHVGDMDDLTTLRAFDRATAQLQDLTGVSPRVLVVDRHPVYRGADWARRTAAGRPVVTVQHHHAHVASAMSENGWPADRAVIGFAFDGTGYGDDAAVWGGEVLVADYSRFVRAAHLKYVPLPGGDAAVRNPCRMALAHLRAAGRPWDHRLPAVAACGPTERAVVARQLDTGLGCTPTSSMGRLFDAVSSLAGICHRAAYEAEAAMRFEALAHGVGDAGGYRFAMDGTEVDAAPVITAVVEDVLAGLRPTVVASRFHAAVADLVLELSERIRAARGLDAVALSGGVFLNAVLTEACLQRLTGAGFTVLRHRLVPPSDAGLALGQLAVGARADERRS